MTTENSDLTTPFYDTLIREREEAGDWTPADLRPPYDLNDVIGKSYERIMVRNQVLRQVAQHQKTKPNAKRDKPQLP